MDNKKLIVDYFPPQITKLTLNENKSGLIKLIGKLQEAEQKNGNGRIYPRNVLLKEVEKYINGPIKSRTSLGELDHPESSVINLSNTSHIINRVWWEGNDLMGELELLPTPSGNIAKALVLAGIPLGISSRGMGSVKQLGETVEVQPDFELLCWDLVSVPSTPNAYVTLSESKKYNIDKYKEINKIITDIICSQTGICPLC